LITSQLYVAEDFVDEARAKRLLAMDWDGGFTAVAMLKAI